MNITQVSILLSLLVAVIIGAVAGRKIKGKTSNFYVAGRSLSAAMIGFALVAQAIDANATMGNTGLANDFGFWAGAALPIGLALSLFILGKWFAPKLNEFKLFTLADFFRLKYNRRIEFLTSLIMLFSFGILVAGNIASVAILIQQFWVIDYGSLVLLICLTIVVYAIGGGIISDIYTDIWQMLLLVGGILATIIFLISRYDFTGIFNVVNAGTIFSSDQLFTLGGGGLINWATIVALGFGNILAIDFCSRILAAKSGQAARRGCYIGAGLTLLLGLPFAFLPVIIQWFGIGPIGNIPILITFAQQVLPSAIFALLVCGIIAAALSTIDGAVLSMGNIFAHNLLHIQRNIDPDNIKETEKTYLYFSRLALLPIICLSMIFALLLPSPGVLLTVAFDVMFAALLIPFLFAFWSKRLSAQAALAAIITGGLSRCIFATLTPTIFGVVNTSLYIPNNWFPPEWDGLGTIIAPVIALVTYSIVAKLTSATVPEQVNQNLQTIL